MHRLSSVRRQASKLPAAVIHSVPDIRHSSDQRIRWLAGRWSDIQGGVVDDLAARTRTAEIPAEEHALRPVVFEAEWRYCFHIGAGVPRTGRVKRFTPRRENTFDPRTLSAAAYSHIRSRCRRL
jgi:hypothetical protein